ncbi:MAG: 23S rRNA (guanosine(2251)-2'-O)-methyltransferase RlmB [Candidatus Dadabacteria bacterium]
MIIYGKNPVKELLADPRSRIDEIIVVKDSKKDGDPEIFALAKRRGVRVQSLPKDAVTRLTGTASHQGVAARVPEWEYSSVGDIIEASRSKLEKLLVVILDHIEDTQNLGAIIRTVDVLGAHGVVIPKDRAASVTPAVIKASAGAVNHVPVARVTNISNVIEELKREGVWIAGADAKAPKPVYEEDLSKVDLGLVIGNEGKGISAKVREKCDFLVSIPQSGTVTSLNASVSAGILIYEIMRQRGRA